MAQAEGVGKRSEQGLAQKAEPGKCRLALLSDTGL